MAHFRARGLALSFGGAFLQQLNLRYCSDAVRSFVLSPRFGRIASRLLRASAVRLYHEQALFKPPGGIDSHWHQDQFSFPFDDTFTMGLWMPLVDCSLDMGPLRFVAGSHKYGNLEGMSISEESPALLRRLRGARAAAVHGGGRPTRRATTSAWRPSCGWPTPPAWTMMPILFDDRRFDDRDPYPGRQDDAQARGAQQPLDAEPRLRHRRRPGALAGPQQLEAYVGDPGVRRSVERRAGGRHRPGRGTRKTERCPWHPRPPSDSCLQLRTRAVDRRPTSRHHT